MIKIVENKDRAIVQERTPNPKHAYACIICGKPVSDPKCELWVHNGGSHAVTLDEGERLNATGHSNADLGYHPIGLECLRKHPELRPYAICNK